MSQSRFEPFYIETSTGRLFALLRAPHGAKRSVLFVPPFGEEMNKCRRQVTETAERLVAAGLGVLVVDLYGTGDSDGEFGDASWSVWRSNVVSAISWIERNGLTLEGVVAIRLGCALAVEALRLSGVRQTVFWQPVENGRQFMTQFLRVRVAASMMEAGPKESVEELKAQLENGDTLEVAGYSLSPELWSETNEVGLSTALHPGVGKLTILELGSRDHVELSVAGTRLLAAASKRSIEARGRRIAGDPFWSSTDIVVNPELANLTVEYLTGQSS